MKYILIKGLRFFDYPGGWLFFRKELDSAKLELLNHVLRTFEGVFVFINLFSEEVDPIIAEKFIKDYIPQNSIVLDEIVDYLDVSVERRLDFSYPEFTSSPLSEKCECLVYDGERFERIDLSSFRVKLEEISVFDELMEVPEESFTLLKGIFWDREVERIKNRRSVKFVGKILKKKNRPKLDALLLEEIETGDET
ncbi:MAG: Uncharacterized protein XD64_0400 [Thermotoga sp. 47_83]|jgi:hypothetical protein|uniref:Uncharacterized protein n=3 Tax=Thermotoga petrophila TaxID=93929 RepID=A5IJN8_THEP1|nr:MULTISPECIES: hypothetical protein [Thermotoga]KUK23638.1 MAG: Uncharacterized protein XD57_0261 [Thermotoga petrophila]KUK33773.1 MAG: Uncharacterized protein XD64_0400 [Thermotoga sp. 47_83]MBZ4660952.1 hypothetical protein [Thermotoga sp.]ABQ46411.1 hypothetical protein Tpet_0385 [Thermotoga petrophila RKU-1]ADA66420.1 conserved hypothetical protein [Thermotoga petrophila RKU-10]